MFPQQQSNANPAALTNPVDVAAALVDVAAVVETRFADDAAQIQTLQRELQQARVREEYARRWILTIRRDHRSKSHARTSRTIKAALASFDTGKALLRSL